MYHIIKDRAKRAKSRRRRWPRYLYIAERGKSQKSQIKSPPYQSVKISPSGAWPDETKEQKTREAIKKKGCFSCSFQGFALCKRLLKMLVQTGKKANYAPIMLQVNDSNEKKTCVNIARQMGFITHINPATHFSIVQCRRITVEYFRSRKKGRVQVCLLTPKQTTCIYNAFF